jgi:hypothetical protein
MAKLKIVAAEMSGTTYKKVETDPAMYVTPDILRSWFNPPFQRPLKINAKILERMEEIKQNGGIIPGILTLGVLGKDTYLIDGQHRREAFCLSELDEGLVSVRTLHFENMADMGQEFVNINSSLVRLKPDDILRGLEQSSDGLLKLRKRCPWVGYDMIRRGPNSPIVSMSAVLKCWFNSEMETPSNTGSVGLSNIAKRFTSKEADELIKFMDIAIAAWGRDSQYYKLWNNLNLIICMWLWRRLVLATFSAKVGRMSVEQFSKCLVAMTSDHTYLDYLVGKQLRERDRSPTYTRIKKIFASTVEKSTGKKPNLPAPEWGKGSTHYLE